MPLSKEHEIFFVHVPRNAGTSVVEALDTDYNRHYTYKHHYREHFRLWKKYHKFAICRNPYTRLVSTYNYVQLEESYWHSIRGNAQDGTHQDFHYCSNHTFEQVVGELYDYFLSGRLSGDEWQKQYSFVYDMQNDDLMVDDVIKFENLPDSFYNLMDKYGIDNVELPKLNSSGTENYMDYYNDMTKEQVQEIYKKDFELFDYEF